jgi:hypothetical protein
MKVVRDLLDDVRKEAGAWRRPSAQTVRRYRHRGDSQNCRDGNAAIRLPLPHCGTSQTSCAPVVRGIVPGGLREVNEHTWVADLYQLTTDTDRQRSTWARQAEQTL